MERIKKSQKLSAVRRSAWNNKVSGTENIETLGTIISHTKFADVHAHPRKCRLLAIIQQLKAAIVM